MTIKFCLALVIALCVALLPSVASANRAFEVKKVVFNKKTKSFDLWVNCDGISYYRLSPDSRLVILKKDFSKNKSLVMIDLGCKSQPLNVDMMVLSVQDLKRIDMKMTVINYDN